MKKYTVGALIGASLVIGLQKVCKKYGIGEKIQNYCAELQKKCMKEEEIPGTTKPEEIK